MNRRRCLAVLAALLLALAAGCGAVQDAGPATTRTQSVPDDVVGADLATAGTLVVRVGSPATLTLTGGENLLDHVRTTVDDGVLVLDVTGPGIWRGPDLSATLVLPAVSVARLSGSGDVTLEAPGGDALSLELGGSGTIDAADMLVESLSVSLDGSGTVRASGRCRVQKVRIDGSGTYAAADLESAEATVVVGGSGRADVTASETLDASISGSGSITYGGGATVRSDVSGSGSVTAR